MESSGEEKKLQALFSELKTADEETAPRFARVWNRAEIKPRRGWALNPAFAAAVVLMFCAVVSMAVWFKYSQSAKPQPVANVNIGPATENLNAVKPEDLPSQIGVTLATPLKNKGQSSKNGSIKRRNSIQLAANRKLTREAKAITDWQSPTSTLLSSSSDELFSSLPQLNENSSGLQSYLPSHPN